MYDGLLVDVLDGGQDALRELLFGSNSDVAEHGAGELGEETFDEIEPGAVLRGEGKFEAALGLASEPGFGFLRSVGGMVVEDNFDRGRSWISSIKEGQEFDELARAMAIPDERMGLAGHEIDPGQEAQSAVALILVITGEGRMNTRLRRQVRHRRANRLHAGFLVVRDDSHGAAWLLRVGLFQNPDLFVDAEDVRHLFFEFGIAALQVVADLVRLHGVCVENFAYSPLPQFREAFVPGRRPIFARMAGQEARCPQLVRIAEVLRFLAGQRRAANEPKAAARSMQRCTV